MPPNRLHVVSLELPRPSKGGFRGHEVGSTLDTFVTGWRQPCCTRTRSGGTVVTCRPRPHGCC